MNYIEFRETFRNNTVIDIRDAETLFNGLDRRRLYEWQQKGYLIRLANNFYMFSDMPVDDNALRTIGLSRKLFSGSSASLPAAAKRSKQMRDSFNTAPFRRGCFSDTMLSKTACTIFIFLIRKKRFWICCIFCPMPIKRMFLQSCA